jgi:hypothetical protein
MVDLTEVLGRVSAALTTLIGKLDGNQTRIDRATSAGLKAESLRDNDASGSATDDADLANLADRIESMPGNSTAFKRTMERLEAILMRLS